MPKNNSWRRRDERYRKALTRQERYIETHGLSAAPIEDFQRAEDRQAPGGSDE